MPFVLQFLESSSSTPLTTSCLNDHEGNKYNTECHTLGEQYKHRSNVVSTYKRRKRNKNEKYKRKQQHYYTADCVIVARNNSE